MTNPNEDYSQDFSDTDDVLSFSNLPIPGYKFNADRISSSSEQDKFEFLNTSFGSESVRNNMAWTKFGNSSFKETRPGFKSGSRSGSMRKARSISIRVGSSGRKGVVSFWPIQKNGSLARIRVNKGQKSCEHARISPNNGTADAETSGGEPKKAGWHGHHFANVLARFGCLSASN